MHRYNRSGIKKHKYYVKPGLLIGMTRHITKISFRFLSRMPHIAGKQQNLDLAKHLTNFWTENGVDHVSLTPYDVLLSYPNMSDLNYVELLDEKGSQVYKSELTEAILTQEENKTGVVPPFNAYSAHGDIKVELFNEKYHHVCQFMVMLVAKHTLTEHFRTFLI